MSEPSSFDRLTARAGILPRYRDALGKEHEVSRETKAALLRAMHIEADSPAEIEASLRGLDEAPWRRLVPPTLVLRTPRRSRRCEVPVSLAVPGRATRLTWRLTAEDGDMRQGSVLFADLPLLAQQDVAGVPFERRTLTLPFTVPIGRHALRVETGEGAHEAAETAVIVAPARCYAPPRVPGRDPRLWGLAVQLYGLRSDRNWGIGDFADLTVLADIAAPLGADAIGVNPLHALFPQWPNHRSPYSPSHRRFLASHYLAIEAMADFAEDATIRDLVAGAEWQQRLSAARAAPLVDYATVAELKRPIFEALFRSFRDRHLVGGEVSERARSFRRYREEMGASLRQFAIFQVLSERFPNDSWRRWPAGYRDPHSAELAAFAADNEERVLFHQYLQWQAAIQACAAHDHAQAAGMTLGLYHDLALAPDGSGAEAWANQQLFAQGATLGAPPDLWNQLGQNWGLPPYVPLAMQADSYRQWSGVLRAIMAYGGALRIDHAIGLERMFWIPEGAGPADGGYVRYPVDDLFAVIALESVCQKSLVIGEDLGTLPDGFHKRMQSNGVLSYRLLYFERDKRGEFVRPARYPALATVAVTTHDLATFEGYWQAHDLDVRDALAQFPSEPVKADSYAGREADRQALLRALVREGLLPAETDEKTAFGAALLEAAYRYIARTPSLLMLLSIEDVVGEIDQANLPGTVDQHPNWQRKMQRDLTALKDDLARLAKAIARERGRLYRLGRAPESDS